ncbi:Fur family peroxide stress response transcriptional regulator [Paenibacillus endophyticus]|uniref:Fur family peroxide stress response transcriptional regulator n=1 Tax=Paenibacillus endophyticus TaxID=1294268 RepID=A0A7W5C7M9_9BACL|nr:transcriptional repressor [Paenibacillus endophyticus]MBB3152658.1 Fur family peroxide stress response transcriptional regulator [Paenibacillus endophyticus]
MNKINLTIQRREILEVVQHAPDHPTAADVIDRLKGKGFNFAYGTVYNSLRYLTDAGLIRELKLGEAVSRYDARTDEHQHIVCTVCGRVDEVLTELPSDWLKKVAAETSYKVDHVQIVLEGVCESCSTKQP